MLTRFEETSNVESETEDFIRRPRKGKKKPETSAFHKESSVTSEEDETVCSINPPSQFLLQVQNSASTSSSNSNGNSLIATSQEPPESSVPTSLINPHGMNSH